MVYTLKPTLAEVEKLLQQQKGNIIPIYQELPSDLHTPVSAYLKLAQNKDYSFLLESAIEREQIGQYSFIGTDPYEIVKTGPKEDKACDPLVYIEKQLSSLRYVKVPGLPSFTGGAVGYISFDCIKYFEPTTACELQDPLGIPESIFLLMDTMVIFDHRFNLMKVVAHIRTDQRPDTPLETLYSEAKDRINQAVQTLTRDHIPLPPQPAIEQGQQGVSNIGQGGYESIVDKLKHNIVQGDIFQAVPSQRVSRPTSLHPFNAYRYLRTVNPVPYLFYLNMRDFQVVGASPEMLVQVKDRVAFTHPIAGTRKRGATPEEDQALADGLLADEKECAEHVMLVDLGRNDVNRVCQPQTVKVDSLMKIERYSHVMHIVSKVSGTLRDDQTGFHAFRSIFPAGTVSGAPKVRAVQLINQYEGEKRGVYAGAVGHFDFSGDLDTCIGIRTMVFKNGVAYLQAGGGIVYDSVPEMEWEETLNKMRSSLRTIEGAEQYHLQLQQADTQP
ncbi:anthranilate synthase component 1 [Dimargaris verticillata]|uniref:anthranilate synthase n=1 Tax=Dimargaris verticillata TaxID=2761393 RepID=A0A9W8BC70_9FUNG|nr:anthranilate synthase component 1 [Dimargaris verticillata]